MKFTISKPTLRKSIDPPLRFVPLQLRLVLQFLPHRGKLGISTFQGFLDFLDMGFLERKGLLEGVLGQGRVLEGVLGKGGVLEGVLGEREGC